MTVRGLRWYEQVGLLRPSGRTTTGHRLYSHGDIVRLQQIQSLKSLGLSLAQIRTFLDDPEVSFASVLAMHLSQVKRQIKSLKQLANLLEDLQRGLAASAAVTTDGLLQILKVMRMYEGYFTQEQMAEFSKKRAEIGDDGMRQAQVQWQNLIAQVQDEMDRGGSPAGPRAQNLARRWQKLVTNFTGGDPDIAARVSKLYKDQPELGKQFGSFISKEMFEFMGQASDHLRAASPSDSQNQS